MRHILKGAALLPIVSLVLFPACAAGSDSVRIPGDELLARVDARLENERDALRESFGHYGLVFDVGQEELHRFMAKIHPRRDGPDIVMASAGGIELHGGGVLALVATFWRPDGRRAELDDVFPFSSSQGMLAMPLRTIYESIRMQIILPIPGIAAAKIDGRLPDEPTLPRIRVQHALRGRLEERELDAFNALALLIRYESDLHAEWMNRLGRRLSAARLLDSTWEHYVAPRSATEEFTDHSYLHLTELLLAYNHRLGARARRAPNRLKQRLLSVELARTDFGGYEPSEALGHYAESLGALLAEPGVTWTTHEKATVVGWLRNLESILLAEIDKAPVQHLTHLQRGLSRIGANADRLQ